MKEMQKRLEKLDAGLERLSPKTLRYKELSSEIERTESIINTLRPDYDLYIDLKAKTSELKRREEEKAAVKY